MLMKLRQEIETRKTFWENEEKIITFTVRRKISSELQKKEINFF